MSPSILLNIVVVQLRCLHLLAKNAGIVMDVVLEDGLALLQINGHEAISVFHRHLFGVRLHGSVFD